MPSSLLTVDNKCLLLHPGLWYLAMAAQADKYKGEAKNTASLESQNNSRKADLAGFCAICGFGRDLTLRLLFWVTLEWNGNDPGALGEAD